MEHADKNPAQYLQDIEQFSLAGEDDIAVTLGAERLLEAIVEAHEHGASEASLAASVGILSAKKRDNHELGLVFDHVTHLLERETLTRDNPSLNDAIDPMVHAFFISRGTNPALSDTQLALVNIEYGEYTSPITNSITDHITNSVDTPLNLSEQKSGLLAGRIIVALELGASHDEILSSVLRKKLRNPNLRLVNEDGPDFLDTLETLGKEREGFSATRVTPGLLDGLEAAATVPANGSKMQRLFLDSSATINAGRPGEQLDRLKAAVRFSLLSSFHGGKTRALGFDPDQITSRRITPTILEHDSGL